MFLNIARSDGPLQTCMASKYTISGCRRFCNARNTLFLTVADLHGPEIHYFWPPQVCMASKYTISDCRRLAWLRNTLFLTVADFAMPEIHYFWLPQVLQRSKYTISGRRRLAWPRNTLFLAAADLHGSEIHYFWSPQVLQRPKYTISAPPRVPQEWKSGHPTRCRSGRFSKKMVGDSLERLQLADGGLGVGRAEDVAAGHEHVGAGIEEHAGRLGVHAAVYLDERL